jgi:phenylacetate-CoA ligase
MRARRSVRRATTTARVLWRQAQATRLPYEPLERIHAVRDARVRQLVAHAATTVPHYRELWRREGIDPARIQTADDLERLPLVEKADLRADQGSFRSEAPGAAAAGCFRTSGSTGIPIEACYDTDALLVNASIGGRQRAILRAVCGKRRLRVLRFEQSDPTIRSVQVINSRLMLTRRRAPAAVSMEEPLERAAAAIDQVKPDLVVGYGSYLEAVFRALGEPRALRHRPRAVRYHGDTMSEEGVRLIEDVFGIPVLGTYGCVECFRIGDVCEIRRGYHVHADLCHVAIVDGSGSLLPAGELGEVVISNLFNRATVLLNYRLGDVAALDPDQCPCGRTTPRLVGLQGRVDEILRLRSGTLVHPSRVSVAVKHIAGYRQYQLVQLGGDRFELRLVAGSDEIFAQAAAQAVPALERVLEGARVEARRCESLVTTARGKLRRVIPLDPEAHA